jgi:flagellin
MDSSSMLAKSLARLSSGSKITSPEEDPAGMAVAMKFDAQINRISATKSNVGNAISFSQTQDGYLQKVGKALNRMSELAVLAQDVTKQPSDLDLYQSEFDTLANYIDETKDMKFNENNLFSANPLDVTTDSDGGTFSMTNVDLSTMATAVLAEDVSVDAATAQATIKTQIDALAANRATVGANISRLTYTNDQLSVLKDNLSAANSRIKDVDVAEESTQFARYNILVQAGTAMLAQANSVPSTALRLLQ